MSFKEFDKDLKTKNPLNFEGYEKKLNQAKLKSDSKEAVITGTGLVNGIKVCAGIMDSLYLRLQVEQECKKGFFLLCKWQR